MGDIIQLNQAEIKEQLKKLLRGTVGWIEKQEQQENLNMQHLYELEKERAN